MNNNTPKAIGYVRVSTGAQDYENQLKAIKEYAKANGYTLLEVFVDRGVSGLKKFSDRPGASKLLKFIENNEIHAILVTSIDRIARDSLDLKNTIDFFKRKGIRLISLSDKEQWVNYLFDEKADDVYKLVANILLETLSFFANFELQKRRERQELAWAAGKQKGRPKKVSDEEILKYLKKYRPQGYSYRTIWAVMKADYERKGKDFISYDRFRKRIAELRKRGKIKVEEKFD
ncbi:resolvase [Thermococci archaeon]|nr:MAG: resolvase [Chloroflexota bacterium]RLF90155.1 MAG: resolvase [Thermococci archaeon]